MSRFRIHDGKLQKQIFCTNRVVNGVRQYPSKGLYVFWVDVD